MTVWIKSYALKDTQDLYILSFSLFQLQLLPCLFFFFFSSLLLALWLPQLGKVYTLPKKPAPLFLSVIRHFFRKDFLIFPVFISFIMWCCPILVRVVIFYLVCVSYYLSTIHTFLNLEYPNVYYKKIKGLTNRSLFSY